MTSAPRGTNGIQTAKGLRRWQRHKGGLSEALRTRTADLHVKAERSGVVHEILRGRATRYAYALLLRNLVPVYEQLEHHLEHNRKEPGMHALALPALYRSQALVSDLWQIWGEAWSASLPVLEAGRRYAERIAAASSRGGERLIAHAYVRYLGDLSGGQVIKGILARSLGLAPAALSFYEFPEIPDLPAFKAGYRDAINRAGLEAGDTQGILEEAAVAFQLNMDVSEAVQATADHSLPVSPDC